MLERCACRLQWDPSGNGRCNYKAVWRGLLHDLGAYAVLIILPTAPASVRTAFERVGRSFVKAGYDVTTMSAERFRAYCHDQPMEYPRAR